jgi:hypothetical protein
MKTMIKCIFGKRDIPASLARFLTEPRANRVGMANTDTNVVIISDCCEIPEEKDKQRACN